MSKHFKIITKEVGREHPIETEFIDDVNRAYLIKFFGQHERDVEWFRIEELQKDGCREQRKKESGWRVPAAVRFIPHSEKVTQ